MAGVERLSDLICVEQPDGMAGVLAEHGVRRPQLLLRAQGDVLEIADGRGDKNDHTLLLFVDERGEELGAGLSPLDRRDEHGIGLVPRLSADGAYLLYFQTAGVQRIDELRKPVRAVDERKAPAEVQAARRRGAQVFERERDLLFAQRLFRIRRRKAARS